MDTGKFTCNVCNGKIRVDLEMCGDTIGCPHCSNSIMVPLTGIKEGMTVASYSLKKRLGMGAMGEVWLAVEPSTGRQTALKILSPALTRNETFIQRFEREVSMAAKMTHPNIITAFDAGVDRGIYYLATNYVEGQDVETTLRKYGRMDEREALAIALLMAEALKYAFNKHNIVHRDIKPSNIMIDKEGTPLLMDLGVSRRVDSHKANITSEGQFVGTPHYMSPEQARAEPMIGPASDIYSLGCSLYHMLAGRVPFNADSNIEILSQHISRIPEPITHLNPATSKSCGDLIAKMLAKEQRDRHRNWDEVISDIICMLEHEHAESDQNQEISASKSYSEEATEVMETEYGRGSAHEKIVYLISGSLFAIFILLLWWLTINF